MNVLPYNLIFFENCVHLIRYQLSGDNNFTGTIPERLFEKLNAAGPTDDDCAGVSFPLWFPNFIGGKWKNFLRMFNTGESSKSNLKILSLCE